jgi:hypothetical protein
MGENKTLSELEKALYVFSRIKETAKEAIEEYENQKTNHKLTEKIKNSLNFSFDEIIDFLIPDKQIQNYLRIIKKVEWPVAIKFFYQALEGYLETHYSREKTTEEVVKDFLKRKLLGI